MAEDAATPGRRTFGPVVIAGFGTAALAAIASAKPWFGVDSTGGGSDASMSAIDSGTRYPVASALSLVLLAAWGVLLVTRGAVRRAFALVAVAAALGLVVAVVVALFTLPDSAGNTFEELMGRNGQESGFTGWYWTAAVASVLAVPPAVLAVRLAASWPEMGSRYDAPGSEPPEGHVVETDRDLWNELDEGRDPTDTGQDTGRESGQP